MIKRFVTSAVVGSVLNDGEVAIDTDTGQIKISDGQNPWDDLPDNTTDLPATIDGGQP